MNYITCKDIVYRLARKKRHWLHGLPTINLEGKNGEFGKLKFNFGDEVISYGIYIKDKDYILDEAHWAIINFNKIHEELCVEYANY